MSIIAGIFVIILAVSIPSPLSIGMYWTLMLSAMLSLICGLSGKFSAKQYVCGVVLGSIFVVLANFAFSAQLSFLLAIFQVLPAMVSALGFSAGCLLSKSAVKPHNNHGQ